MSLGWIIVLPLLGALINGYHALSAARRQQPVIPGLVNVVGVAMPLLAFFVALSFGLRFIFGQSEPLHDQLFSWIAVGQLKIEAALMLDRLSTVMVLIITGVGSLIHIYSMGYMKGDPAYARYFAYLNLFLAAMLTLVLGDNLLMLFLGWEGVGLCSYLLIGFWFDDAAKAQAGKKAFLVNRIGDFGFLLGIFVLIAVLLPQADGTASVLNFAYLKSQVASLSQAQFLGYAAPVVITLLLFVGATGKSAQIPLYVWLPDAMAGPTPVSALIHAATMVTAGVYMIARLHFLFDLAPFTLHVVAIIGATTALFAALIALVQTDIKKVLAYSTVSQLGYMFLAMGVGAYAYGVLHLMTHAFFKACLFLGSGSVIHGLHGEQDIRKMGGLKKYMPITAGTFLVATLAIAGIPPLSGFFSKDHILFQTFVRGNVVLWGLGIGAALCTAFYMFRLYILTFQGQSRMSPEVEAKVHESPRSMSLALIKLAILAAVAGFIALPPVLGGGDWWSQWLQFPTLGESIITHGEAMHAHGADHHSLELILMLVSVAVAVSGAAIAFLLYRNGFAKSVQLKSSLRPLYNLFSNKFYVDELYDWLIVQPLQRISQNFCTKFFDRKLIDGALVNGSARLLKSAGSVLSLLQSGLVNRYALYFFTALALFFVFLWWIF